ncbi:MAG TPA: hypothetical protein VKY74_09295 [Chloroflexia bacterium]|nr:hypothetical protein [Chloroflexia bacterium]
MMNTWGYTLLLAPPAPLPDATIRELLQRAAASGYVAVNPGTGLVSGFDAQDEWAYPSLELAVPLLRDGGSSIRLWKYLSPQVLSHLLVFFDSRGVGEAADIQAHFPLDSPSFGALSIGVFDVELQERTRVSPQPWDVDADVKQIFGEFCGCLGAPYGYSSDDIVEEAFMDQWVIHRPVHDRQPPALLFWLQYLAADYAAAAGLAQMAALGGQVEELPGGVLVSFFPHPWEVRVDRIEALNAAWRKIQAAR